MKQVTLTEKQKNFCRLYMKSGNPVDSYRKAYNKPNMVSKDASSNANKLLKNPKIQTFMDNHFAKVNRAGILDAHGLLVFWSNTINDPDAKMNDKIRCSELIGKYHQMFVQKVEADVNGTSSVEINILGDDNSEA